MTATDCKTTAQSSAATAPTPVAKAPPRYGVGQPVVLKKYEDGWRWKVVDARLLRPQDPYWSYTCETVRPYDGKLVQAFFPEWRLRPVPEDAT